MGNSPSPQKREKQKKPKVVSPRRQQFETKFEKYFIQKHVDESFVEKPEAPLSKFDTITKADGSLNQKMKQRLDREAEEKKRVKAMKKDLTIEQLEAKMERAYEEE